MFCSRFSEVDLHEARLAITALKYGTVYLPNKITQFTQMEENYKFAISININIKYYYIQSIQYNIQLINSCKMNQQISFSEGVSEYLSMALKIWPAMQLCIQNLHEITSPPKGSPIPPRNYQAMTHAQFLEVMTKDMCKYIYQHDVTTQHIIDYLNDILAMLNTEQENQNTIEFMANQLILLISELPQGDATRLIKFRTFYHTVKDKKLQHILQQEYLSSHSEGQQQQDDQEQQSQNSQENDQNNLQEQVPKLSTETEVQTQKTKQQPQQQQQKQQNNQEEDDGWIVVKKKSKK